MKRPRILRILFHLFGLGTLTTAVVTQILMLEAIRQHGIFIAKEPNITVCIIELAATILGAAYLIYLFATTIRKLAQGHRNPQPSS